MNTAFVEHGKAFRARLLALLVEYERRSIRELVRLMGASSTSIVSHHLHRLADEGRIEITHGVARSIRVVRDERSPDYLAGYAAGYHAAQEAAHDRQ